MKKEKILNKVYQVIDTIIHDYQEETEEPNIKLTQSNFSKFKALFGEELTNDLVTLQFLNGLEDWDEFPDEELTFYLNKDHFKLNTQIIINGKKFLKHFISFKNNNFKINFVDKTINEKGLITLNALFTNKITSNILGDLSFTPDLPYKKEQFIFDKMCRIVTQSLQDKQHNFSEVSSIFQYNFLNNFNILDNLVTINLLNILKNKESISLKQLQNYFESFNLNLNVTDDDKKTLLHHAIFSKYSNEVIIYITNQFIENDMDLNFQDSSGRTSLFYASKILDEEVIKFLKEKGAKIKPSNKRKLFCDAPDERDYNNKRFNLDEGDDENIPKILGDLSPEE